MSAKEHWRDPLYRNAYFIMGNVFVPAVAGLVFLRLAARVYQTEAIGAAVTLFSVLSFIAVASRVGLDGYLLRFGHETGQAQQANEINASLTRVATIAIIASTIFLAVSPTIFPNVATVLHRPAFIGVFLLAVVTFAWGGLTDALFISHGEARYAFLSNSAGAILRLIIPILPLAWPAVFGVFLGYAFASIIAASVAVLILIPRVAHGYHFRPAWRLEANRGTALFSGANYSVGVTQAVQGALVNTIIYHFFGAASAAFFFVALLLSNIFLVIPNSLAGPLVREGTIDPAMFDARLRRALLFTFAITAPAAIILSALSTEILGVISSAFAIGAGTILSVLAIGAIAAIPSVFYIAYLRVHLRGRLLLTFSLANVIGIVGGIFVASALGANLVEVSFVLLGVQTIVGVWGLTALLEKKSAKEARA